MDGGHGPDSPEPDDDKCKISLDLSRLGSEQDDEDDSASSDTDSTLDTPAVDVAPPNKGKNHHLGMTLLYKGNGK